MDPEDPTSGREHEGEEPLAIPAPQAIASPAEPTGFKLSRETVTLGDVVAAASDAWRRDIGTWVLATVLLIFISYGLPLVLELIVGVMGALVPEDGSNEALRAITKGLEIGVQILQVIVGGVLTMGFWAMTIHALHGRPAPIAALFSQISKAVRYVVQQIVVFIVPAFVLGLIAALVVPAFVHDVDLDMPLDEAYRRFAPALWVILAVATPILTYVFLGIAFAVNELTFDDRVGALEAVARSWRIVRGHRWLVLGTLIIAGIIAMASLALCFVGFLFGGPFASLMVSALYLALRDGAEVPAPDTGSTLGHHH